MSPLTESGGDRRRIGLAQGDAERLLQPHRGRERERAAAAQHFFQGRKAELGLFGQRLPGDAAARDFLANGLGHLPALLGGKLLVRRRHRHPWSGSAGYRDLIRDVHLRHKTAQSRLSPGRSRRITAEQCRSFCSRHHDAVSHNSARNTTIPGSDEMTICDEIQIETADPRLLAQIVKLLLFLVMQGVAVIAGRIRGLVRQLRAGVVGGRHAGRHRQAERGALRLAAVQDRRRLCRCDAARRRCRPHGIRPDHPRPRHADIPQPDARTGSRRPTSIRCRRAARSTRSRWWSATASSSATSRSGSRPRRSTSRPAPTGARPR